MVCAFFSPYPEKDPEALLALVGKDPLLQALDQMLLIRHFEQRAEAAYLQGKIGGFFHSYIGQEAIQTGALLAVGPHHWWTTTYRCHALALLLGESPESLMAELFGRATGNAKGRGGSMHLFSKRLLGGFGIVGGHLPVATGAAFTLKYQKSVEEISLCFLGEGAIPQGAFHEALNLASLWNLPILYVIENNQWGMGTHVSRAVAARERLAEKISGAYGIEGYAVNGMDLIATTLAFRHFLKEIQTKERPLLVEMVCERFKGHSISDPGLYRTKEGLQQSMQRDPIALLRVRLERAGWLSEAEFTERDQAQKSRVLAALTFAEESPWPSPLTLEEDVFA